MTQYHTATLPCGLRIIHEPTASDVVYCGYVVAAGTRHEAPSESGLAHFIEHLSFKGTARRRAWHIANGLERVGGDLNAFTTKQETVYHAAVLRSDFGRAADLLTDIVFHSTYPQREIVREAAVVCDEIDSYEDSPSEIIFDEFESLLFEGHPLGRDILGSAERLREYTTDDVLCYVRRHYRPDNAIFFASGNLDFRMLVRTLSRLMTAEKHSGIPAKHSDIPIKHSGSPTKYSGMSERHSGDSESLVSFDETGKNEPCPYDCTSGPNAGVTRVVEKKTHQAHVLIGGRTFGGRNTRWYALCLLNNMLGGPGMNSRLNMNLRERAGLVYSVESSISTYPDTGYWNVYFGCDAADVNRCRRLVERELRRFIDVGLTPAQLAAARKQLIGQTGIARDANESRTLAFGKSYAHYGRVRSMEEIRDGLAAVTATDLQETAALVYAPEKLTTLIYR